MRKYLLKPDGNWYKANMHCHTTNSDGRKTPEEIKELYKSNGYSAVCFTDHNRYIYHKYLDDKDFIALAGFEADVCTPDWKYCYHLNAFALDPENCSYVERIDEDGKPYVYTVESINKYIKKLNDNNFLVMYNHPSWSLNTPKDFMGLEGVFAVEIYNHSCEVENRTGYDGVFYDMMLRSGKKYKCLATDDNHNVVDFKHYHSGSCGGWIMIKADELTHNSLMQSIKDGQFYSSQGPQIHNIYIEDGYITVECSEAQSIFVLTADRHGAVYHQDDGKCTKMTFKLEDWFGYVRFEIFDKERKMAMSNPYFLKDYLD